MANLGPVGYRPLGSGNLRLALLPTRLAFRPMRGLAGFVYGALTPYTGKGSISGVTLVGTPPTPGTAKVAVYLNSDNPNGKDGMLLVALRRSEPDGTFNILGLKAGRYRVIVSDNDAHFPRLFLVDVTE